MGRVNFSRYKHFKHWIKEEQFAELESFVLREVPQFPKPIPMPSRNNKKWAQCSLSVGSTEEGSTSGRSDDDVFTTDDEPVPPSISLAAPSTAALQSSPPTPDHKSSFRDPFRLDGRRPSHTGDTLVITNPIIQSMSTLLGCPSPNAGHRSLNHNAGSLEASLACSFFSLHGSAPSIGKEAMGIGNFTFGASLGGSSPNSPAMASSRCSMSPTRYHASRIPASRSFTPCHTPTASTPVPSWRSCFVAGHAL